MYKYHLKDILLKKMLLVKASIVNVIPNFLTAIIILALPFYSAKSDAQWYETQGYSRVDDNSIEIARAKAMENALKKALLVAGASVSSVQQVVNGLLTQDNISIRASGSVNSIELIDELHTDNMISVTVRADIFPQEKKCFAVDLKKTLLLTRSHIVNREQASVGQIYDLDKAIIKQLNNKLKHKSVYTTTKVLLRQKTSFSRLNENMQDEQIKSLTMALRNKTDSQFILFSEINDISLDNEATNSLQFWQLNTFKRNFSINFYLYDARSGELIWQQGYRDKALWDYKSRDVVNVNTSVFWKNDYGIMINELLTDAVMGIDENVMCESSQGKIILVLGDQITINLGRDQGVKIGDEFTLLHQKIFFANDGKKYSGFNVSPYKVKVTKLSRQTAIASTSDGKLLGNIQIDDLAIRK